MKYQPLLIHLILKPSLLKTRTGTVFMTSSAFVDTFNAKAVLVEDQNGYYFMTYQPLLIHLMLKPSMGTIFLIKRIKECIPVRMFLV